MEVRDIRQLDPLLRAYLAQFDDCFARQDTRAHLPISICGQLSNLERKSVDRSPWRPASPPRRLQEFLSQLPWDHQRMRDRLQEIAAHQAAAAAQRIGIIDETSGVKKGDNTPSAQRQDLGGVGKQENGIVTVPLGLAVGAFHCLLDRDLFLPEGRHANQMRCREAGIPTMGFSARRRRSPRGFSTVRGPTAWSWTG